MTWEIEGLVTHSIYLIWGCDVVALECDSDLKSNTPEKMACSLNEIFFLPLYSESYLLTLET